MVALVWAAAWFRFVLFTDFLPSEVKIYLSFILGQLKYSYFMRLQNTS